MALITSSIRNSCNNIGTARHRPQTRAFTSRYTCSTPGARETGPTTLLEVVREALFRFLTSRLQSIAGTGKPTLITVRCSVLPIRHPCHPQNPSTSTCDGPALSACKRHEMCHSAGSPLCKRKYPSRPSQRVVRVGELLFLLPVSRRHAYSAWLLGEGSRACKLLHAADVGSASDLLPLLL